MSSCQRFTKLLDHYQVISSRSKNRGQYKTLDQLQLRTRELPAILFFSLVLDLRQIMLKLLNDLVGVSFLCFRFGTFLLNCMPVHQ